MTFKAVQYFGSQRTGGLEKTSVLGINKKLKFSANLQDDPLKIKNSWGVQVEFTSREQTKYGVRDKDWFQIWDYKGSELHGKFQTFGDEKVLKAVFGKKVTV